MKQFTSLAAMSLLALLLLSACGLKDKSYATSPSLRALIGTTTGNVAFRPPEPPPAPVAPPADWELHFSLATFSRLENEQPSLQVVLQVRTHPGAGFEFWLLDEAGQAVARWSAGATTSYVGTVCFQLELARDGEAVPLGSGEHRAIVVFREFGGQVIAAREARVTGNAPRLEGTVPAPNSPVYREALACPKGS
ncbi:hypothetical protein [Tepidiforma thermophila]|uniref:Intracellular proteinase inhibitor BsuPI domain-containing protein n=1 Tax=Tepidiforma thermophila (strain KCTC 52669 / CGMCC 1.13589 / G233) TaxID=2761530 RepID=A0A2A9HDV5_TEPT2|nr:hypothetical protein [Tepidiforma thermophila]PFG72979.1 hypothetical protein A9A59_0172 [Tepidiforma thermophila]